MYEVHVHKLTEIINSKMGANIVLCIRKRRFLLKNRTSKELLYHDKKVFSAVLGRIYEQLKLLS